MEKVDTPPTEKEIKTLREGIQAKYITHHLLDRDRFPAFEYNTNRANYEPLRKSFEEEFYTVRGVDRTSSSLHIPSTNTLALLFCADGYVPGKKILNTCYSYAEGKSRIGTRNAVPVVKRPGTTSARALLLVSAVVLVSFIAYRLIPRLPPASSAGELRISRPGPGETVPRQLLVTGKASGADMVWIVVRAVGGVKYWVQPPAKVEENNLWRGQIYIGSQDEGDIGVRSQVRAFVNPRQALKEGDVLYGWPDAERASEKIEVIRGATDE